MMGRTAHESETVIRFDENGSEAIIYTASARVSKWMDKQFERVRTFTDSRGNFTGAEYRLPKNLVRIKPKGARSLFVGGR